MRCPECIKEGKESEVSVSRVSMTTLMARPPIRYDKSGKMLISKDPNRRTTACWCSNGHKGTREQWSRESREVK